METKNENMHKKKIHYGVIFSFSFERSLKGCGKNFSFFLFQKLPCNWNIISWNILRQYWRLNFFLFLVLVSGDCVYGYSNLIRKSSFYINFSFFIFWCWSEFYVEILLHMKLTNVRWFIYYLYFSDIWKYFS